MNKELEEKYQALQEHLMSMDRILVAFSGGVDSTLVLGVAIEVLGEKVLAVTAESDSLPKRELDACRSLAESLGTYHRVIETEEMQSENYLQNPANRCYFCKSELYGKLKSIAKEEGFSHIVNGINVDDLGDYRPGITAAREADVKTPLADLGFTKQDIRDLSRYLDLPTWEKPAMACLSSRIPYGNTISPEKLEKIELAEDFLIAEGFSQNRVRYHEDVARIELPTQDILRFFKEGLAEKTQSRFKEIGFRYVAVDILGYRSGSMNEVLNRQQKEE